MFKLYQNIIKELLTLAFPMIIGNVSHLVIAFIDIFIASRYSTSALSAIGLATAISTIPFFLGVGFLQSISPVLANVRGSGKNIDEYFSTTVKYILFFAFVITVLSYSVIPLIDFCGFEKELIPEIKTYIAITNIGIIGAYFHGGLKDFLQAKEDVVFANLISFIGIFINLILNYVFVFGFAFIPSMGCKGLAVATLLVRLIMGITMFTYCFVKRQKQMPFDFSYIKTLLKVGLPISLVLLLEFTAFNLVTILAGRISGIHAAVNMIVVNISSITFMIPMAISNSIAIKVGFFNGAKNIDNVRRYAKTGVSLCVFIMLMIAFLLVNFKEFYIPVFSSDINIQQLAYPVISIIACFQMFDGLQAALGGLLKGLKKTKNIFVALIIGYWGVGIPLIFYLGVYKNLQLVGFWWGLCCGLIVVSLVLLFFSMRYLRKKCI